MSSTVCSIRLPFGIGFAYFEGRSLKHTGRVGSPKILLLHPLQEPPKGSKRCDIYT